jgi:tRNA(Arg) A34 adenosine deaminase TadA
MPTDRTTTRDASLLRACFDLARRARERGNHPFAAILVAPSGEVLLEAENEYLPDRDATAHAERLLATRASRAFDAKVLASCTMYASAEPCAMCAAAVSLARLKALRFAAEDPKGGAVVHGPRIFAQPTCHHRPDVLGGIGEAEAAELLRGFFAERR